MGRRLSSICTIEQRCVLSRLTRSPRSAEAAISSCAPGDAGRRYPSTPRRYGVPDGSKAIAANFI